MAGVLLYDGDCRFCARSARWLERHATSTARVEAWQQADLAPLGLAAADCADGLQWVDHGRHVEGPEAVAAYLATSTDRWRTAGRILTAPASKRVTWPVYRWMAHRRAPASGVPVRGVADPAALAKRVRPRRPKDLAACANLLAVTFSAGQYPVSWPDAPRAWLSADEVLEAWVFERGGEVHGHIAISKVGLDTLSALRWREVTGHDPSRLAGISRFFVRPRLRGQGIGTALLDVAVAEIRARGLVPVLDLVSASTDAVRLYEDLGWRRRASYPWGDKDQDLQIYYYESPPELRRHEVATHGQ